MSWCPAAPPRDAPTISPENKTATRNQSRDNLLGGFVPSPMPRAIGRKTASAERGGVFASAAMGSFGFVSSVARSSQLRPLVGTILADGTSWDIPGRPPSTRARRGSPTRTPKSPPRHTAPSTVGRRLTKVGQNPRFPRDFRQAGELPAGPTFGRRNRQVPVLSPRGFGSNFGM